MYACVYILGLQQRIDKIDKNRLLNALATNLVVDSLCRAINKLLVGAALFTAGSSYMFPGFYVHHFSQKGSYVPL